MTVHIRMSSALSCRTGASRVRHGKLPSNGLAFSCGRGALGSASQNTTDIARRGEWLNCPTPLSLTQHLRSRIRKVITELDTSMSGPLDSFVARDTPMAGRLDGFAALGRAILAVLVDTMG